MNRREFLLGAAVTPAALLPLGANAAEGLPTDVGAALAQFRKSIPSHFNQDYVEHVLIPFFLTSVFQGERPLLPLIDVTLSKENAFPVEFLGLIYKGWKPSREEGVTVFLQGLEYRGENNLRKKIYMSALTPDLYRSMYRDKVVGFFDQLLDEKNAGKPFLRHYLDYYFDIYWDLHVGVKGSAVPAEIRQIGDSFNTVLAYLNPMQQIVYENYMKVRTNIDVLKGWIDARVEDVNNRRIPGPEKTFVHYWLKNAGDGEHFSKHDIVFECFHNFVALSQWGNMLYEIMSRLRKDGGDPAVQASFVKTMTSDYDQAHNTPYTPLVLFVMELFRTIASNAGSISTIKDSRQSVHGGSPFQMLGTPYERHSYIVTPHPATSFDPVHWRNPLAFDPERYRSVPTSDQIDEAKCQQIGLAKCPFDPTSFEVADGRKASIRNSGFGTVFGVVDGKTLPVCDYAGFAPFGFGYRRCPGELLTIEVFSDFLRKVWRDQIEFSKLGLPNPGMVPIGPNSVIADDLSFRRRA
jgi:cytochrome P450